MQSGSDSHCRSTRNAAKMSPIEGDVEDRQGRFYSTRIHARLGTSPSTGPIIVPTGRSTTSWTTTLVNDTQGTLDETFRWLGGSRMPTTRPSSRLLKHSKQTTIANLDETPWAALKGTKGKHRDQGLLLQYAPGIT